MTQSLRAVNWKVTGLISAVVLALGAWWVWKTILEKDESQLLVCTIQNESIPTIAFQIHQSNELFEPISALTYTVFKERNAVSSACMFDGTDDEVQLSNFRLYAADSILYLTWLNAPNEILAAYNLRTKQNYPDCALTIQESTALGEKMLAQLKRTCPYLRLKN